MLKILSHLQATAIISKLTSSTWDTQFFGTVSLMGGALLLCRDEGRYRPMGPSQSVTSPLGSTPMSIKS